MSKIIAITGATGAQGGAIAYKLLETGAWKVRGITRNPSSDKAKALQAAGAEVVQADMDDEVSLAKAFEGAHAIFAVTNFWEHLFSGSTQEQSGDKEEAQGMSLARVAAQVPTLEHYIWSTLAPASKMSGGKLPCPHWDYKAAVDDRIREELPALAAKTTFLCFSFYSSNMALFPSGKPLPTIPGMGPHIWIMPCAPSTPMTVTGALSNAGIIVRQALAHPDKTHGRYLSVDTETKSMAGLLADWSEVSGHRAVYIEVPAATYAEMWGVAGAELASQFKNNEVYPDWQAWCKEGYVRHQDIGVNEGELVGHKAALEEFKELM